MLVVTPSTMEIPPETFFFFFALVEVPQLTGGRSTRFENRKACTNHKELTHNEHVFHVNLNSQQVG
jgi:hypothetical protein